MKTEVLSISEFLHREKEPIFMKVEKHFKKYGIVYKIAGVTIILLTSSSSVLAASAIDAGARAFYYELAGIGKWIIGFKGAFDIIKNITNGDFDSAKKSFFSYLVLYLFLLGLPFGLDKVDHVFSKMVNA
jgi:hypothetical protein